MKAASKHLQPLILPGIFQFERQSEYLEMMAASVIVSHMLWPDVKEERSRSLYLTLCLKQIHDVLLATNKEQAQTIFTSLVDLFFGGWQQYSQCLVDAHFPSRGKGSIVERYWQGALIGRVVLYASFKEVSLNDAAKKISEEFQSASPVEVLNNLPHPAPGNIMKNYWPRFQSVAHFWAAMHYLVVPGPTGGILRLDRAIPTTEWIGKVLPGWRGLVEMAQSFLELSANVKRYKTHKPLLDQEMAFRVLFME